MFSEPVASATLTTATVQLFEGTSPVSGTPRLIAGSLFAVEFVPNEDLAPTTTYRVVVRQGVQDLDGDPLEAEVATDFTTTATTGPGASLVFSCVDKTSK